MLIEAVDYPWAIHLLWTVPLFAIGSYYARKRSHDKLSSFLHGNVLPQLTQPSIAGKVVMKTALGCLALVFMTIAATGPRWGTYYQEAEMQGRDVMFLLDCSRSMLAEDIHPNRLERAKADIRELVGTLQGDRIGIIAFAGSAKILCPLTTDYGFFHLILSETDIRSIGRGGTMIGDAIRLALDAFGDGANRYQDIILITDGEDDKIVSSFPVEAAKKAKERNIAIHTIGIGNDRDGSLIPITNDKGERSYIQKDGEVIRSKLDSALLREIAGITGGQYLHLSVHTANIQRFYLSAIGRQAKKTMEVQQIERHYPRFQWPVGLAILALLLEMKLTVFHKVIGSHEDAQDA